MPVSTNNPVPAPSKFEYVASGSGTYTGNGAVQNIASFSVGELTNKTLIIYLTCKKILGAANVHIGLEHTAATSPATAGFFSEFTTLNDVMYCRIEITRCPDTTSALGVQHTMLLGAATNQTQNMSVNANFDVSTTETFYLNGDNVAAGNNVAYYYSAFIIDN